MKKCQKIDLNTVFVLISNSFHLKLTEFTCLPMVIQFSTYFYESMSEKAWKKYFLTIQVELNTLLLFKPEFLTFFTLVAKK